MYDTFDIFGGDNYPTSCPPPDYDWSESCRDFLGNYPSTSVLFGLFGITSLGFSIVIAFKYNYIKVLNRRVHSATISNTFWIVFYFTDGLRQIFNSVRFAMLETEGTRLKDTLFLGSLVLYGVTTLSLSFALNHQRKYRSSSMINNSKESHENDPLLSSNSHSILRGLNAISLLEYGFLSLFLVYIIFLYLEIAQSDHTVFEILFLSIFALQRFPIVILAFFIVINRSNEGPTRRNKLYLCLATLINAVGYLPTALWIDLLPEGCVIFIANWIDLMESLHAISLVLFFLFLRNEYIRNMEETIWKTVSTIQSTSFNFKRF